MVKELGPCILEKTTVDGNLSKTSCFSLDKELPCGSSIDIFFFQIKANDTSKNFLIVTIVQRWVLWLWKYSYLGWKVLFGILYKTLKHQIDNRTGGSRKLLLTLVLVFIPDRNYFLTVLCLLDRWINVPHTMRSWQIFSNWLLQTLSINAHYC